MELISRICEDATLPDPCKGNRCVSYIRAAGTNFVAVNIFGGDYFPLAF